ncbi:hypothetical protein WBG78_26525 [Chryseolinea sp. T2]|uniref:hypothetical protein n=1 Tax=Chryseolinea sp. T2 TaxID=3129255 RepID=UPI00307758D8
MKPLLIRTSFMLASALISFSCNDNAFPDAAYPRMNTLPVTNVSSTGATFHGSTLQNGTEEIINRGFVWSTKQSVTLEDGQRIDLGPGPEEFDAEVLSGLSPKTIYYVKAFAITKNYTVYAPYVQFASN